MQASALTCRLDLGDDLEVRGRIVLGAAEVVLDGSEEVAKE